MRIVSLLSLSLLLVFLYSQKEKFLAGYISDKLGKSFYVKEVTWDLKTVSLKNFQIGKNTHANNCHLRLEPKWSAITSKEISFEKISGQFGAAKLRARLGLKPKKFGTLLKLSGQLSRASINDVLNCLDLSEDEVDGEITIPNFYAQVKFDQNGLPLASSVKGHGDLVLHQGKFKFLNLVSPVVSALNPFPRQDDKIEHEKSFDQINAKFVIENEIVQLEDIKFDSTYMSASGSGEISFDSEMDIELFAKGLEKYIPFDKILLDQVLPRGLVPIRVSGRLEDPKVRPSVTAIPKNLTPKLFDRVVEWFN